MTLITEEIWFDPKISGIKKKFGWVSPYSVPFIAYMAEGAIELWDSEAYVTWYMEQLRVANESDPDFLPREMTIYRAQLAELEAYWKRGKLENLEELQSFLSLMAEAALGFDLFYFTATNDKSPAAARTLALEIRETDSFYDSSDKVLRATLSHLYAELKGYESVLLLSEIGQTLPSQAELAERKKHFVAIYHQKCEAISLKDFAVQNPEYTFLIEEPLKEDFQTLKGQTAYKGVVRGKVRVVRLKEQISSFQEGEVLVAAMTTPDYISAMHKAVAFVTDEGGITCHAGILARELHKPCVIGTKFATEVLKDGNMVEVDADKGIIRILT